MNDNKLKQEERKKKRTRKHKGKLGKVSTRKNLKKEEGPAAALAISGPIKP